MTATPRFLKKSVTCKQSSFKKSNAEG
uniref:Serine/threonine-protein kinase RIO1 n=1 Tax=Arundo donax TaxID=35708 RepID=A0A0A9D1Y3_ARUDO